ncbi:MAG: DUF4232 domain-containing protein [Acidimicrobiales bacterium]
MIDTERVLRDTLRERAETVKVPEDFDARVNAMGRRIKLRRRRRGAAVVLCVFAVAALVVGLLVVDDDSGSDLVVAGSVGASSTVAQSIATSLSAAQPNTTTASTGPSAQCRGGDLVVILGRSGVAAGTFSQVILLTNTGTNACSLAGQPKLEVLVRQNPSDPSATPLAVPLVIPDREPNAAPATVTLRTGQSAQVELYGSTVQNYPNRKCPGDKLPDSTVDSRFLIPDDPTAGFGPLPMHDYICSPTITAFQPAATADVAVRTFTSPLGRRVAPTAVWTGSELMVWGGDNGSGNNVQFTGSLFNPTNGTWRPMSSTVLRGAPVAAVWAKDRVVFAASEVAVYEPTSDRWSGYRGGLLEKNAPLLAYTGSDVVGWFFEIGTGGTGLRVNPANTQITENVASPPAAIGYDATPVWTGREWMIFPATGSTGIAFDPSANRWRTVPAAPVNFVSRGLVTWTGTDVIAYGTTVRQSHLLTGAAYHPDTNTWELLPTIPVLASTLAVGNSFDAGPRLTWNDDHALLSTGATDTALALFVIDPYLTRTQPTPPLPSPPEKGTPLISSGSEAFLLLQSGELAAITIR